jgi:tripartite-type tricarboxylate transporter receptor subunit TctC
MTVLSAAAGGAMAAFPERTITIVVPFAPGGGTGLAAEMLAPRIERELGPQACVRVAYKPGAGGEAGFAAIAEAPPDGHTIGMIVIPNTVTIPIERQARYSLGALDPLIGLVEDPGVWMVRTDSPYHSMKDLIAAASVQPTTISVGSTGVGSRDHLAMLRLQAMSKARFIHVPFPGAATADKALEGGKISVAGFGLGEALRLMRNRDFRLLGLAAERRDPAVPDLATFREQGFDLVTSSLRGIAAPAGLPPDIRARLVEALERAAHDPSFIEESRAAANPLRLLSAAEFAHELSEADFAYRALWRVSPWVK